MKIFRLSLVIAISSFMMSCGKNAQVEASGPFLHVKLSLDMVDTFATEAGQRGLETATQLKTALHLIKDLGIQSVEVLAQKSDDELDVLMYCAANTDFLSKVSSNVFCSAFIKKTGDSAIFKLDLPKAKSFNQELLLAQFGRTVVLGSAEVVKSCVKSKKLPSLSRVEQFYGDDKSAGLAISVACSDKIEESFKEVLMPLLEGAKDSFGLSPMVAHVVNSFTKRLITPLKQVEGVNISATLAGNCRNIKWTHWCRDPEDVSELYNASKEEDYLDFADESFIGVLSRMKLLRPNVNLDGNALAISISWEKKDDMESLSELKEAGKELFSTLVQGAYIEPSQKSRNEPAIIYTNFLGISADYSISDMKKSLPSKVKASLLYNGFSKGSGKWPSKVQFTKHKVDIVNSDLCSFKYEPKGLFADGKNILLQNNKRYFFSGGVSFTTESEEKPQKALLSVNTELPVNIQMIELSREDVGRVKMVGDVKVLLKKFDSDAVKIATSAGSSHKKILAFDKKQYCLVASNVQNKATVVSSSFKGAADKVKFYFYDTEKFSFDLDLDVPEKKLEMPKENTLDIPCLYATQGDTFYNNPDLSKLNSLDVTYDQKSKSLVLNVDEKGMKLSDRWNCKFFGKGQEIIPSQGWGSFTLSDGGVKYVKKNISSCKDCEVVSGSVKLNIDSGLKFYELTKKLPVEVSAEGVKYRMSITKNCVEFYKASAEGRDKKAEVLAVVAFDKKGRMLHKYHGSRYSSGINKDGNFSSKIYQFWGAVDHAIVQLKTAEVEREVTFEEVIDDNYDKAAYAKFKLLLQDDKKMHELLQSIKKQRSKISYSSNAKRFPALSGLYYVIDKRKGSIVAGIPREVAHANKTGASIFGYTCEPFRGYYFRYPTKVIRGKKHSLLKGDEMLQFSYQKDGKTLTGEFSKCSSDGEILAIPVDASTKIYYMNGWGDVYRYTGEKKEVDCGPDLYGREKGDWITIN